MKTCKLVCYFPGGAAKIEQVYSNDSTPVNRVRVEPLGEHNLLYVAERAEGAEPMLTYRPVETLILPKDFPCRLSPVETSKEVLTTGG